jgi:hypothetical protein
VKNHDKALAPGGLDRRDLDLEQWRRKLDSEDFGSQGRIKVPNLHARSMLPVVVSVQSLPPIS